MVGIEAGAYGLPAVAFDVGGISDWLIPGFSGELAPGNPPAAEGLAAKTRLEAEAVAYKTKQQADADAYARAVNAEANAKAIAIVGTAESDVIAAKIKASGSTDNYTSILRASAATKWDGSVPKIQLGASDKGSQPVIVLPSQVTP